MKVCLLLLLLSFPASAAAPCFQEFAALESEKEFESLEELDSWAKKSFEDMQSLSIDQQLAVRRYQAQWYNSINPLLRLGKKKYIAVTPTDATFTPEALRRSVDKLYRLVDLLDDSFAKTKLDRPMVLYRAVKRSTLERVLGGSIQPGKSYLEAGYSSTAGVRSGALHWEQFLRSDDVVTLRIHAAKGLPALYPGLFDAGQMDEAEIILPRNLQYTVRAAPVTVGGRSIIDVDVSLVGQ